MIPPLIIQRAVDLGIGLIAITDHNSCANVGAVMEAARGSGVTVLPGMELQTREEVHLLCLFDTLQQALTWQDYVLAVYPAQENDPEHFGEQYIVDATGGLIQSERRLLLTSAQMSLEEAVQGVNELGGLPIPAHINRQANGLIAQLGLVPPIFEALEISRHLTPLQARQRFPQIGVLPLLQSGDVHFLDGFLGATYFDIEEPVLAEIHRAVRGELGRKMWVASQPGF